MIRSQKTKPLYLPTPKATPARRNSMANLKFLFLFLNIVPLNQKGIDR